MVAQSTSGEGRIWRGTFDSPLIEVQAVGGGPADIALSGPDAGIFGWWPSPNLLDSALLDSSGVFATPVAGLPVPNDLIPTVQLDINSNHDIGALIQSEATLRFAVAHDVPGSPADPPLGSDPSVGAGMSAPSEDRSAPHISIRRSSLRQTRRRKAVAITIACDELCSLRGSARLRFPNASLPKGVRFGGPNASVVRTELPIGTARVRRGGLKHVRVQIAIRASETAGNTRTRRSTVGLR